MSTTKVAGADGVLVDVSLPGEVGRNGHAEKALKYEFDVNGKQVRLKRTVPMRDGHRLIALLQACASNDLDDQVAVCRVMIHSWEFAGDPGDAEAYAGLDIFDEFLPLSAAVITHVQQRTERLTTKN